MDQEAKLKRTKTILMIIGAAVLCLIILGGVSTGCYFWGLARRPTTTTTTTTSTTTTCSPVDCEWGNWSSWSACSINCGSGGTQYHERHFRRQAMCGGQECDGSNIEKMSCNPECYNGGTFAPTNDQCVCQLGYCGANCETTNDCVVSDWGEWSTCSQECGLNGTQFRIRNVLNVSGCGKIVCKHKPTTEERVCNTICYNNGTFNTAHGCVCTQGYSGPCCDCTTQDCVMAPWGEWSACSHTCGPLGRRFRTRYVERIPECGGNECSLSLVEQQQCNQICYNNGKLQQSEERCHCPDGFSGECCDCEDIDCELRQWSEWSPCSQTCGSLGTRLCGNATRQVRSRDVERRAMCAGNDCNSTLTEERMCEDILDMFILPKSAVISMSVYAACLTLAFCALVFCYCKIKRQLKQPVTKSNK